LRYLDGIRATIVSHHANVENNPFTDFRSTEEQKDAKVKKWLTNLKP
jgi:hypothetical protein